MPYNRIPGVDENFNFPPEILAAIMASDEFEDKVELIENYVKKAISDESKKQHNYGEELPTATEDKVVGRLYYRTKNNTLYVYSGTGWLPIGGRTVVPLANLLAFANGHSIAPGTESTPYIFRRDDEIQLKLRIKRNRTLQHALTIFSLKPAYEAYGNGLTSMSGVQSGGTTSAAPIACGIDNTNNRFVAFSPSNSSDIIEFAGSFLIKT